MRLITLITLLSTFVFQFSKCSSKTSLQSKSVRQVDSEKTEEEKEKLWNVSVKEAQKKQDFPRVILHGRCPGRLALTFDDGLSLNTLKVLKILRENNIKATFFILGEKLAKDLIQDGPEWEILTPKELIDLIISEGHEVASHSFSHPNFLQLSNEEIVEQMEKTGDQFKALISDNPRFMRPPYGYLDLRVIQILEELGYFIICWSIDTDDWKVGTEEWRAEPQFAIDNFKRRINPDCSKYSGIVLMHDNHGKIHEYLPKIIEHARELGYEFSKVSEILGGVNPFFEAELPK